MLWIKFMSASCEIALRWMPQNTFDNKSTLVQVMAWCQMTPSHYLSKWWPRFKSPYVITRWQCVKIHGIWWYNLCNGFNVRYISLYYNWFNSSKWVWSNVVVMTISSHQGSRRYEPSATIMIGDCHGNSMYYIWQSIKGRRRIIFLVNIKSQELCKMFIFLLCFYFYQFLHIFLSYPHPTKLWGWGFTLSISPSVRWQHGVWGVTLVCFGTEVMYAISCCIEPHYNDIHVYGLGFETVAVLLPGFAINW